MYQPVIYSTVTSSQRIAQYIAKTAILQDELHLNHSFKLPKKSYLINQQYHNLKIPQFNEDDAKDTMNVYNLYWSFYKKKNF